MMIKFIALHTKRDSADKIIEKNRLRFETDHWREYLELGGNQSQGSGEMHK
jgi:hypothetical protein